MPDYQRLMTRIAPWSKTLATYGFSQLTIAVGAFARIPLLLAWVGSSGYGAILVGSGVAVVVLAVGDAFAQAARVCASEDPKSRSIARLIQLASSWFLIFMAFMLLGTALVFNLPAFSGEWKSAVLCITTSSLAILGGPARGLLDSLGRTALTQFMQASTTLVGLPILILTMSISPSLEVASAATGIGLAMPALFSLVMYSLLSRDRRMSNLTRPNLGTTFTSSEAKAVLHTLVWSWSNTLSYAFDSLIIASILSTEFAAEYGLASRVMTLAMMISLGLNPIVSTKIAVWRSTCSAATFARNVIRLGAILGSLGAVVSLVSVPVGPWIGNILSRGAIPANMGLYWSLAGFATVSALTLPLFASFSGIGVVHVRAIVSAVGSVINLALSIGLTGVIGVVGPSVASLMVLVFTALILATYWRRNRDSMMSLYRLAES